MKRLAGTLFALTMCAVLTAQGTFTIRRPANGSKVRETVLVRIPKNSIPDFGYLGVYVNNKFLEAVMPPVEGDDYVYRLDTKARNIPDGETTIEMVLFQDAGNGPRILNRSSVKVIVDNHTGIKVPEDGLKLRYKFTAGKELVYQTETRQSISFLSQALAQLGSRGREIPMDVERYRMMYAIDNVYNTASGREGLIRIQALPDKGKDYAILTVDGETQPKRYYSHEMHPIYMRIDATGREVFSSAPNYWPMEGSGGDVARFDLYALWPLPVLPTKNVSPGSKWETPTLLPDIDLDKKDEVQSYVDKLPSAGSLEGVEWERGVPCAKIRTQVAQGAEDLKAAAASGNLNQVQGETQNIRIEQLFWFALDRGVIIRNELFLTQEALVTPGSGGGGGSGSGGGGSTPNSAPPPSTTGSSNVGGRMTMPFQYRPHVENGQLNLFVLQPRTTGSSTPGQQDEDQNNQGGFGNRSGGGSTQGAKQIVRITRHRTMFLEL